MRQPKNPAATAPPGGHLDGGPAAEPAGRVFTRKELARYDGSVPGRPVLVAFEGRVYDVTESFPWRRGIHWACARAGEDATGKMARAPHDRGMLRRVPCVGRLAD